MLKKFLISVSLYILTLNVANSAVYVEPNSGLGFQAAGIDLSSSWSVATVDDVGTLFTGPFGGYDIWNPSFIPVFHQGYVDTILTLGGVAVSGSYYRLDVLFDADQFGGRPSYLQRTALFVIYQESNQGVWELTAYYNAAPLEFNCSDESLCPGSNTLFVNQVPVPAAAWLFGSALIGLTGIKRKK